MSVFADLPESFVRYKIVEPTAENWRSSTPGSYGTITIRVR